MKVHAATVQQIIDALLNPEVTEIWLVKGHTYTLTSAYGGGQNAFPVIGSARIVTFFGSGATLTRSSSAHFRFFRIDGGQLTLNSLTLANGSIDENVVPTDRRGGAVYISGSNSGLTLQDCTFRDNTVLGITTGSVYGGAVDAVSTAAPLVFRSSLFEGNSAREGGAIHVAGVALLQLVGCTFSQNYARSNGGAVEALGGTIAIDSCTFTGNGRLPGNSGLTVRGGAIYNNGTTVTVSNSAFNANEAVQGAVAVKTLHTQKFSFRSCAFTHNLTSPGSYSLQAENPALNGGIDARLCWWGDPGGPGGYGPGSGDRISSNVAWDPFYPTEEALHTGTAECPLSYATDDSATTPNPISLRFGEKRLRQTDLSLNTGHEPLQFTRSYRQDLLDDPDFDAAHRVMGLGWTHNHHFFMAAPVKTDPPQAQLSARLPEGGTLVLFFDRVNTSDPDIHHYVGTAGSTTRAQVVYSGAGGDVTRITIKTSDRTQFVLSPFMETCYLTTRIFPDGARWTYSYGETTAGVSLEAVADDLGCRLAFSYLSSGFADEPVLQRVEAYRNGALVAAVDFDYGPEMEDGVSVGFQARPLLESVTDVRGNVWTYDYYGSSPGETGTPNPLNYFKQRLSPPLASLADQVNVLEQVAYTLDDGVITGIVQQRGIPEGSSSALLTTELQFHAGDDADQTRESVAGVTRTHSFQRGVLAQTRYEGFAGNAPGTGTREAGSVLRPSRQTDANGNVTRLGWRESGALLDTVTDALGATTAFEYEALQDDGEGDMAEGGRLLTLVNALGEQTRYCYDDRLRQPTLVLNGLNCVPTALRVDDAAGQGAWTSVLPGSVVSNLICNRVGQGYHRRVTTANALSGIRSNAFDVISGRGYTATAVVRSVTANPVDLVLTVEGVGTLTPAQSVGPDWTELTFASVAASTLTSQLRVFVDQTSGGSFEIQQATVLEGAFVEKVDDAFFEQPPAGFGASWGTFGTPEPNILRIGSTDAGQKSRYVKTAAADAGIESQVSVSLAGQKYYLVLARVYPIVGRVQMCFSTAGILSAVTAAEQTGTWVTLRKVITAETAATQKLRFLAYGAPAEFVVDTVHVIECDRLLGWRDFRYDGRWRTVEESTVNPESGLLVQQTRRSYDVAAGWRGLLKTLEPVDVDGTSQSCQTIYTYDLAGRVAQTRVTREPTGDCHVSYSVYDAAGNLVAGIQNYHVLGGSPPTDAASAQALYDPAIPDRNIVTTYAYDELNRRLTATTHAGAADPTPPANFAQTAYTVYDALDRVVLTVAHYVNGGLYASPATWRWDASSECWRDDAGSGTIIAHGADGHNNENIISQTDYNPRGLIRRQRDTAGNVTLFGYDRADRLIKTVRSASQPDYDPAMADLALEFYPGTGNALSPASDRDIIATQVYDAAGNLVLSTEHPDFADVCSVTLHGLDPLNRVVKVIRAASHPGYDFSQDHALAAYEASAAVDEDLVTGTVYDLAGRVEASIDAAGVVSRTVYDAGGRIKYTIQNYVPQFSGDRAVDPASWRWAPPDAAGPGRWVYPTEGANTAAVDHGLQHDENILAETLYDSDGRVQSMRDVQGRLTYNVYDGLGRQVKSIANYVPQGTPDQWTWLAGADGWNWYTDPGGTTPVAHGDHQDQNLITATHYDASGRADFTRNPDGTRTLTVFDPFGKVLKTVQNCDDTVTPLAAAAWTWKATGSGWAWCTTAAGTTPIARGANDENIVTAGVSRLESARACLEANSRCSRSFVGLSPHWQFAPRLPDVPGYHLVPFRLD